MIRTRLLGFVLATLPAAVAHAFEAVDTLPYPSSGAFPAYEATAEQPFGLWAQAGYMYDTNVFRTSAAEQSEQILRVGGGIRQDPSSSAASACA
jgi:hypothetical protein